MTDIKQTNSTPSSVSEAESIILEILWLSAPLTANDIFARIDGQDWTMATVKTLINRLMKKGALLHEQQGRRYLYSPAIERQDFLKTQNQSFLHRFYQGKLGQLVAEFASNEKLDQNEISEIRAILDQMEDDND